MNETLSAVVSIALAIVGLAFLAVLVSKNANTASIIGVSGSAFSNALGAAEAPVSGSGAYLNQNSPHIYGPQYA